MKPTGGIEKAGKILIVDDDEDVRVTAALLLKKHFSLVKTEADPRKIPSLLTETPFDVLLLDMNFRPNATGGKEGLQWLTKARELSPATAVVMITAYGEIELAVEAVKRGAADFILKPWRNERLIATLNAAFTRESSPDLSEGEFLGRSPAMQKVFELIRRVAPTDANVLITGENGTGKELAARALWRASRRANRTFVAVDMGALSQSLFESELFGRTKGAFTDAKDDRPGRFEAADGGTLFLDEIGNLPVELQVKLLAALQNRQVTRLGSNKPISVDVRLLCATNARLDELATKGEFRQDLLYRINTVEIKIPPLRERPEDIPLLVAHYLTYYCGRYQKKFDIPTPTALSTLARYPWPGNVRELRHAVERAVILADSGPLPLPDFLPETTPEIDVNTASVNLEELEKAAVVKAMRRHNGNISRAAQELGLTRAALYRRLEKYDVRP